PRRPLQSFPTRRSSDLHPEYLEALLEVAERERVDVVFPQSSAEVGAISAGAERFGVPVLVSSPDAIERASAKSETVRLAGRLGIDRKSTRLNSSHLGIS